MTEGIGSVVIVGGTSGLGRELAKRYAGIGRHVVITGRDPARAAGIAAQLGGKVTSAAFDLAEPHRVAAGLAGVEGPVEHLVLAAIERDTNTVAEFDVDRAARLATIKVVGYVEVIHALRARFSGDASILLFGGQARERPYPGSTTVTTVNGAVTTMVNTLVSELKPVRVNAIHPGIVVDSPYWAGNDAVVENTAKQSPTGRGTTMADVVDACAFLLENASVNGVNLRVDCGLR
jgi:NAD(P)-dependent dehydrogenase (short-subunit alcohol dehydrogenase family)